MQEEVATEVVSAAVARAFDLSKPPEIEAVQPNDAAAGTLASCKSPEYNDFKRRRMCLCHIKLTSNIETGLT